MVRTNMTDGAFKNGFYRGLGLALGLLFTGIIVLAIYVGFKSPLNILYDKYAAISPQSSTSLPAVEKPLDGTVPRVSMVDIRNDIIAYYNTFITMLVALLGATAIIGYLHLRYVSKEEAEQNASEALENWLDLEKTHRLFEQRIGNAVGEWAIDKESIAARVALLEERVEYDRQYPDLGSSVDPEGE